MQELIERARGLIAALPYIQRFRGKTFVDQVRRPCDAARPELQTGFAQDIVLLHAVGINPVVVHGGGPQINQIIDKLGLKSTFVRGMRVTDAPTMEAVEMVLQKISKEIVAHDFAPGRARGGALGQGRRSDCRAQIENAVIGDNGRRTRSMSDWSVKSRRSIQRCWRRCARPALSR